MKRDMDLVREILLYVENQDINSTTIDSIDISGHSQAEIMNHVKLMEQYGLLTGCSFDLSGNTFVQSITWEGYDYLDKIRDNLIWSKTKDTIKKKGLPLIFETIKTVATAFITSAAEGVANAIIKNGG